MELLDLFDDSDLFDNNPKKTIDPIKLDKLFEEIPAASSSSSAPGAENSNKDALVAQPEEPLLGMHMEEDPEFMPDIQNVVAFFHLCCEIDIKTANFRLRNAEYNPRNKNALIIRLRLPKCTAIVYSGGKCSVTGPQSLEDAEYAGKKITKMMQKLGYKEARFTNFQVESIVAKADAGFPIRLEQLTYEHKAQATYEPELFAGCVYRMNDPKCSFLIFVTGKMVISGTRNMEELEAALRNIFTIVSRFNT